MGWPVNLAADLLSTAGSDGDLEGGTMEIGLGVRKYFPMGEKIQLYGQVGLPFISANAKVDGTSFDESGSGIGFALNGGALNPVTDMFKVGVDLRLSSGNADFGDPVGDVARVDSPSVWLWPWACSPRPSA